MWEKVVLNLLSNAFKYTFEGTVTVRVEEADGRAVLRVADTGTGIPEHELPHVFERFHRVEGARGRTLEGSGIGLALVAELVKIHGGNVGVESRLGEGSTFTASIPLGTAHLPADRIGAAPALSSTAIGAEAYLEEALRWLPGEQRHAAGFRGRGNGSVARERSARPKAAPGREECWLPTTTPTCANTSAGCWGRGMKWRRRRTGPRHCAPRRSDRPTWCWPT